jgi:hypothetical protein
MGLLLHFHGMGGIGHLKLRGGMVVISVNTLQVEMAVLPICVGNHDVMSWSLGWVQVVGSDHMSFACCIILQNYEPSSCPASTERYMIGPTEFLVHLKRFSAAFQLMTSQIALKYSALRFWYWRLDAVSISSQCPAP